MLPFRLFNLYSYQILWQLPNLIIVPILAPFLESHHVVFFAKMMFAAAIIHMISDWGQSTLGARNLAKNIGSHRRIRWVFVEGEYRRATVFALCIFALGFLMFSDIVAESAPQEKWAFFVFTGMAASAQVLFPNWLVVGLEAYRSANLYLLIIRGVSLGVLLAGLWIDVEFNSLLLAYLFLLLVTTIVARKKILYSKGLVMPMLISFAAILKGGKRMKGGFLLVSGGVVSYATLNSGVFVADYLWGTSAAASYAAAERLVTAARAAYLPITQYLIIRLASEEGKTASGVWVDESRILVILGSGGLFMAFLLWIVGEAYFTFALDDEMALNSFRILVIGYAVLGFAHYYCTVSLLGHNRVLAWWLALIFCFLVYCSMLLLVPVSSSSLYSLAVCVVGAEIGLVLYGYVLALCRRKRV